MLLRRVRPGEGSRIRELRLRALAESPGAFGRTHAEEAAHDDEWWHRHADAGRIVVAEEEGGGWLGMAGGFADPGTPGRAELWGVWVDPIVRGRGIGESLVEAVAAWAREEGFTRLELQVAEPDGAAARLYRRLGFADAGRPADGGCKLRMERAL